MKRVTSPSVLTRMLATSVSTHTACSPITWEMISETSSTCFRLASPRVQLIMTGTLPATMAAMTVRSAPTEAGNMMPKRFSGYSRMTRASASTAVLSFLKVKIARSSPMAGTGPIRSQFVRKQ